MDYTINDAHKDGFDSGLLYALRYYHEVEGRHMTDREIARLARHLESHKSSRDSDEWVDLINRNQARWRG